MATKLAEEMNKTVIIIYKPISNIHESGRHLFFFSILQFLL